jgi:O-antigen/teichoic acid export membrane protein
MRIGLIVRAVTTSWIAVIANAVVGFLLTPYVLHHLGDEQFGLWILVTTVTGFYGFFDAGVRSSILRYVSKHHALGDSDGVRDVLATSFYFYVVGCFITILLTFAMIPWLPHFFHIQGETASSFQHLFLLAGIIQGVCLPLNVFIGALEASARFDQVYMARVTGLVFRVVAVIAALRMGAGLFGLGAAVLLTNLLSYLIQIPLAIRVVPEFSVSPRWFDKATLRKMTGYGAITLTTGIGMQLRTYLYPVILAKYLSAVAVTIFSLPMKLLSFPLEGLATMTEVVNPVSSHLEAKQDYAKLRQLITLSVQTAFLIFIPMAVLLVVYGRELLTFWVGGKYASAYPLLVILTIGLGSSGTLSSVQSMLYGIEKHKGMMWFRLGEGFAIATLGIFMVHFWGLLGFAIVMGGVLFLTSLFFIPRHLCGIVGLRLRDYLVEGALKPLLVAIPMTVVLVGLHALHIVHGWPTLFAVALAGGVTFLLTVLALGFMPPGARPELLTVGVIDIIFERFVRNGKFRALFVVEAAPLK